MREDQLRSLRAHQNNNVVMMAIFVFALILGVCTGLYLLPLISPTGVAHEKFLQFISSNKEITSAFIGAIFTLFAAAIAWFAVQRQISAQRNIATIEREEARLFIVVTLQEYANLINIAWKQLDKLESRVAEFDQIVKTCNKIFFMHSSFEEEYSRILYAGDMASKKMSLQDQFYLKELIGQILRTNELISDSLERFRQPNGHNECYIRNTPDQFCASFSWLDYNFRRFDVNLGKIFAGRNRYIVHDDQMSEQYEWVFSQG